MIGSLLSMPAASLLTWLGLILGAISITGIVLALVWQYRINRRGGA